VPAAPLCASCRQRQVEEAWRPFCSERCKLQDLTRWLDGAYRVPGDPVPADDGPAQDAAPDRDSHDS